MSDTFLNAINDLAESIVHQALELSAADRARIKAHLLTYVALNSAPDAKEVRDEFAFQVDELVRDLRFKVIDGRLRVTTTPAGEHAVILLKRGTLWFRGHENVEQLILAGYLDSALQARS